MLSIRMQRTGRKADPMFRIVVQDSRRTSTSGNVIAFLGNYNPHTKELVLNKDKIKVYLNNGAQPSSRVIGLLNQQKITLPTWVKKPIKQIAKIKSPEKLRRNKTTAVEVSEDLKPDIEEEVLSESVPEAVEAKEA